MRQYAGVVGKVDNCQISVHASLSNEKFCTLIGTELFLPDGWTKDKARCQDAGVPEAEQEYQTKPELALRLVKKAIDAGVEYDFIGGDGLYGHNAELTRSLDKLGQFYVLDVHKDELIFLSEKIKYSLSNGEKEQYTNNEWAYFQCSRYWVERCFDDSKNELGMSGYQVTGWLAWQHHMALVMMASFYILKLKLEQQDEMPLLSVRDARLLVIAVLFATQKEVDLCLEHIRIRHRQRQSDIDRYFRENLF